MKPNLFLGVLLVWLAVSAVLDSANAVAFSLEYASSSITGQAGRDILRKAGPGKGRQCLRHSDSTGYETVLKLDSLENAVKNC